MELIDNYLVRITSLDCDEDEQTGIDFEFTSVDAASHFIQIALNHNNKIRATIEYFPKTD